MPSWPRRQDQAGRLLDALAEAAGALWRVLPDGSIFFGQDSFTTSRAIEDTDYQLLSSDPEWKLQTIAPLTAAGLLAPGVSFGPAGLGGWGGQGHEGRGVVRQGRDSFWRTRASSTPVNGFATISRMPAARAAVSASGPRLPEMSTIGRSARRPSAGACSSHRSRRRC